MTPARVRFARSLLLMVAVLYVAQRITGDDPFGLSILDPQINNLLASLH